MFKLKKVFLFIATGLLFFGVAIGVLSASWTYDELKGTAYTAEGTNTKESVDSVAYYKISTKTYYFTKVHKAIECANDAASSSTKITIYVIPGKNHNLEKSETLSAYVTLCLPYDSEKWSGYGSSEGVSYQGHSDSSYRKNLLTFGENVTLTISNNAVLQIGGQTNKEGQGIVGSIAGNYSEIRLNYKSEIIVESGGSFYCHGYVRKNSSTTTDSKIEIESGGYLQAPLAIYDYKGGSATSTLHGEGVAPISVFDFPSFHTKLKINSGSAFIGFVTLTASAMTRTAFVAIVTNGNYQYTNGISSSKIKYTALQLTSGYIELEYVPELFDEMFPSITFPTGTTNNNSNKNYLYHDKSTTKASLHGTLSLGRIYLDANVLKIDTDSYSYPLGKNFNFEICSGSTLNIGKLTRLMPGISFVIDSGATVNITNHVIMAEEGYSETVQCYPTNYTLERNKDKKELIPSPVFINNGTINVSAGASLDGLVQTTSVGAQLNYNSTITSHSTEGGASKTVITNTLKGECLDYSKTPCHSLKELAAVSSYTSDGNDTDGYYWKGGLSDTFLISYSYIFEGVTQGEVTNPNPLSFDSNTSFDFLYSLQTTDSNAVCSSFYDDPSLTNEITSFDGFNYVDDARASLTHDVTIYAKFIDIHSLTGYGFIEVYDKSQSLFDSKFAVADGNNALSLASYFESLNADKNISYSPKKYSWEFISGWKIDTYVEDELASSENNTTLDTTLIYADGTTYKVYPIVDQKLATYSSLSFTTSSSSISNGDSATFIGTLVWTGDPLINEVREKIGFEWGSSYGSGSVSTTDDAVSGNLSTSYTSITTSDSLSFEIKSTVKNGNQSTSNASTDISLTIKDIASGSQIGSVTKSKVTLSGSCLLEDTKVLLANGTYKMAKDLTVNDKVLSLNHFTGQYEATNLSFVVVNEGIFDVVDLTFENEKRITIALGHGFYNCDRQKYEIYYGEEFFDHIGEKFVSVEMSGDGIVNTPVKLVSVQIRKEYKKIYSPISAFNYNLVANDMLTIPDDVEGIFDMYQYDENLVVKSEISNYIFNICGLLDYDDFKEYAPEYAFDIMNFKFMKAALITGCITIEKINYLLSKYLPMIVEQNNLVWDCENQKYLPDDYVQTVLRK